jgi:sec-independent protein translocase protein TatC
MSQNPTEPNPSLESTENLTEMTIWSHFSALKQFVLWAFSSTFLGAIFSLIFIDHIWSFLMWPFPSQSKAVLMNITPQDAIFINLRLAMLGGVILASPIIIWRFYRFLAPGLFLKEKSLILPLMFWSVFFLLGGCSFAFGIVVPLSLNFLQSYGHVGISQSWTQQSYLDFVIRVTGAFGIMFEIPVFCWVLAKMGLLSSAFMKEQFRMAIVVIFILAAVLTPPDIASQLMLALPMIILYAMSILIVKRVEKARAICLD